MTREEMTCKAFVDFLMAYLDGELPGDQRDTFETHLVACPPCQVYLETYRDTVALGQGCCGDDDPVPDDVPEALVGAILAARRKA
jgi:anti-sigma factor RsiW